MQNDGKTELIDRYLDKGMSDAEERLFEKNMSEDPDFRQEVAAQEATRNAMRNQAEKEKLQSLFRSFHKELDELDRGGQHGLVLDRDSVSTANDHVKKPTRGNWSYIVWIVLVAIVIIGLWKLVF